MNPCFCYQHPNGAAYYIVIYVYTKKKIGKKKTKLHILYYVINYDVVVESVVAGRGAQVKNLSIDRQWFNVSTCNTLNVTPSNEKSTAAIAVVYLWTNFGGGELLNTRHTQYCTSFLKSLKIQEQCPNKHKL